MTDHLDTPPEQPAPARTPSAVVVQPLRAWQRPAGGAADAWRPLALAHLRERRPQPDRCRPPRLRPWARIPMPPNSRGACCERTTPTVWRRLWRVDAPKFSGCDSLSVGRWMIRRTPRRSTGEASLRPRPKRVRATSRAFVTASTGRRSLVPARNACAGDPFRHQPRLMTGYLPIRKTVVRKGLLRME